MTQMEVQKQPGKDATAAVHPARVLMGVPAPGATGGGPALHLPMLVEDLRAAGHTITTFPYGRWSEGEGLATKIFHQLVDLLRYPGLLRHARPDLVHLNTAFDRRAIVRDVGFGLVTRLSGRPLLLKWHGSELELLDTRSPLWRPLVSGLLHLATRIAVLSTEEAAALGRRRGPRSVVVRNGLDLGRYTQRRPVRDRLGVPARAPLLLFIGRLLPAKGLLDVVQALPEVVAPEPPHLVVVGEGPDRASAEALAGELGLGARVHFTGRVSEDEAADYYCGCDVLVFPTYHAEGFPMTVFQSMAAGLGIVTTRARAAADHLREPDNCLFVPPRDPAALARALARLLGDPELLARMRNANRAGAGRFDRRVVAQDFSRIYSEMVEDR